MTKKLEWFGRARVTEDMRVEIEKRLKEAGDDLPHWTMTEQKLVIHEWEADRKPAPFELRFDVTYSKGLVHEGYGEKDEKRYAIIQNILKYIDKHSPSVKIVPKLDLDAGFTVFEDC